MVEIADLEPREKWTSALVHSYAGSIKINMLDEGANPDPDLTHRVPGTSALEVAYRAWHMLGKPLDEHDPFNQLRHL